MPRIAKGRKCVVPGRICNSIVSQGMIEWDALNNATFLVATVATGNGTPLRLVSD